MCNTDAEITTKKECPKCKSTEVAYQGLSHGGGARGEGGNIPSANHHQYKCEKCGEVFYYTGKNP
jgi:transposase-like protein